MKKIRSCWQIHCTS